MSKGVAIRKALKLLKLKLDIPAPDCMAICQLHYNIFCVQSSQFGLMLAQGKRSKTHGVHNGNGSSFQGYEYTDISLVQLEILA